jgi:hypothetical protein
MEIPQRVHPLLGNNLETNNATTSAAREHILNKQVYTEPGVITGPPFSWGM